MLENYECKFQTRGKIIFVPNERSVRKGRRILKFFSKFEFPDYFYHYKSGGHVAALHAHLENKLFFKIDIQNFYYSIARMRVTRALRSWGYPGANTLAKWSCVANPYPGPRHVLPIGFVQSPLLASLVLLKSPVAEAIERAIKNGVCISVYLDDFVGSHNDPAVLEAAYDDILDTCVSARLVPNPAKLLTPRAAITAFNCDLTEGSVLVTTERVAKYYASTTRTVETDAAFEEYRNLMASANKAAI
jgi:Reverse transcriptase (RNA-dependent DNA polymerase)